MEMRLPVAAGAAVIGCGVGAKLLVGKNFALFCLFKTRV
jgi:hypothetical protein